MVRQPFVKHLNRVGPCNLTAACALLKLVLDRGGNYADGMSHQPRYHGRDTIDR